MHEYHVALWIACGILSIAGLAGMILPALPGSPLLFLGFLCGAWADNFVYVGPWTLAILAVLAALTYLVEFAASLAGAKQFGASKLALAGAAVGGLVGLFFGLPGIILGPFIGAVLGELYQMKSLGQASIAGFGAVVGLAVGIAGKLAIGMVMIGIFLFARFL